MTYILIMRVIRFKPYIRACKAMSLAEADMLAIEQDIAAAPDRHPTMKGLRGVRKARIALAGRGKSGGGRVVFYVTIAPSILFMLTAYPKSEQADLTASQRRAILTLLDEIEGDKP